MTAWVMDDEFRRQVATVVAQELRRAGVQAVEHKPPRVGYAPSATVILKESLESATDRLAAPEDLPTAEAEFCRIKDDGSYEIHTDRDPIELHNRLPGGFAEGTLGEWKMVLGAKQFVPLAASGQLFVILCAPLPGRNEVPDPVGDEDPPILGVFSESSGNVVGLDDTGNFVYTGRSVPVSNPWQLSFEHGTLMLVGPSPLGGQWIPIAADCFGDSESFDASAELCFPVEGGGAESAIDPRDVDIPT